MDDIRVIVMPYELGRLRTASVAGRSACSSRARRRRSPAGGVPVTTEILESSGRACSEVKASFELIRQVSARVRAAVEDGAFPVVLSGSCFAAVGVMAGLTEPSPAVVWLDAHADFNSPETTVFAAPRAHGDGQIVTPADRRPASVRSQHN